MSFKFELPMPGKRKKKDIKARMLSSICFYFIHGEIAEISVNAFHSLTKNLFFCFF